MVVLPCGRGLGSDHCCCCLRFVMDGMPPQVPAPLVSNAAGRLQRGRVCRAARLAGASPLGPAALGREMRCSSLIVVLSSTVQVQLCIRYAPDDLSHFLKASHYYKLEKVPSESGVLVSLCHGTNTLLFPPCARHQQAYSLCAEQPQPLYQDMVFILSRMGNAR